MSFAGRVVKNRKFAHLKYVKIENRRIALKFAGEGALSVSNKKTHHFRFPGRVVRNRIFGNIKSVKI